MTFDQAKPPPTKRPVTFVWFPLQAGLAITLPFLGRTFVFHRQRHISKRVRGHELIHAEQIDRMGAWEYLRQHVGQRNAKYGRWRVWSRAWMFGREIALEREAYDLESARI